MSTLLVSSEGWSCYLTMILLYVEEEILFKWNGVSSFWRHLVTPLLGLENIIYGVGQKEVFWQKSIMSKKDKVNFC